MILDASATEARQTSIPRESGDDPIFKGVNSRADTYSPRERG